MFVCTTAAGQGAFNVRVRNQGRAYNGGVAQAVYCRTGFKAAHDGLQLAPCNFSCPQILAAWAREHPTAGGFGGRGYVPPLCLAPFAQPYLVIFLPYTPYS